MTRTITVVSLNPAIDRTIEVPGFEQGATNRLTSSRLDPGGKGNNVARVLSSLGAPVQVLGFLGTENGELLVRTLAERGIRFQFVEVPGENRVNLKIIEPENGRLTEINDAGFTVGSEHLERLTHLVQAALPDTSVLVLSGSLPSGVPPACYRDLIRLAGAAGVPTVVDADGEPMLLALEARPFLIKPNREEAERLVGRTLQSRADLIQAAAELVARGPETVVISSGPAGAALVNRSDRLLATPPVIRASSPVGAGDSMVAGLALGISRGLPITEQLRIAIAAGAATARLEGTQVCTSQDIAALLPNVTITPFDAVTGGEKKS